MVSSKAFHYLCKIGSGKKIPLTSRTTWSCTRNLVGTSRPISMKCGMYYPWVLMNGLRPKFVTIPPSPPLPPPPPKGGFRNQLTDLDEI